MRNRIILCFIVLLTIFACSRENLPKGILPRKKMVPILVDIHLADAINNQKYTLSLIRDSLSEDLYLSICKKYNVERADIQNSLLWYGKNTRAFVPVYDEVLNILSEMEVKAKSDTIRPSGFNLDTTKVKTSPPPPPSPAQTIR
jgi:hypothetical protein